MRIARLSPQIVGKRLAKTILDSTTGRPLLTAGTALSMQHVEALLRRGYMSVYVQNELMPDLEVNEVVNEETRLRASRLMRDILAAIPASGSGAPDRTLRAAQIDMRRVQSVVHEIVDALDGHTDLCFGLSTIRCIHDELFEHSVNVCVLSVALAAALHYNRKQLLDVGVGALLHDIGKIAIRDLLEKVEPLTPDDWRRITEHPRIGFEILRTHFEISLLSAHIAFQHHERLDGSGYPRGLTGDEIHPYARICAIADYYDALTHDRPYRARLEHTEVTQTIVDKAGKELDATMVRKFLNLVAHYPTGSIVKLSTGQIAVVVAQSGRDAARPKVRVVSDDKCQLVTPYDVDLSASADLAIERILEDYPLRLLEHARQRRLVRS